MSPMMSIMPNNDVTYDIQFDIVVHRRTLSVVNPGIAKILTWYLTKYRYYYTKYLRKCENST